MRQFCANSEYQFICVHFHQMISSHHMSYTYNWLSGTDSISGSQKRKRVLYLWEYVELLARKEVQFKTVFSSYKRYVTAYPGIHLTNTYMSIYLTHLNVLHPARMNNDLSSFNTFHSLCFYSDVGNSGIGHLQSSLFGTFNCGPFPSTCTSQGTVTDRKFRHTWTKYRSC